MPRLLVLGFVDVAVRTLCSSTSCSIRVRCAMMLTLVLAVTAFHLTLVVVAVSELATRSMMTTLACMADAATTISP